MIAIIDYGLGNLTSVLNAFERMSIPAKIITLRSLRCMRPPLFGIL